MGTRRSAVQRPLNKALVRFEQALFAIKCVARAFAFHSFVTGDLEFLREKAWPILSVVAYVRASQRPRASSF
jgi:hypothetical protein